MAGAARTQRLKPVQAEAHLSRASALRDGANEKIEEQRNQQQQQ